jgi:hypothetical protein
MFQVFSGLVITCAGAGSLWYVRPRNGRVHPLALRPMLDFLIPIGIVTALALGIALVVTGFAD